VCVRPEWLGLSSSATALEKSSYTGLAYQSEGMQAHGHSPPKAQCERQAQQFAGPFACEIRKR
jgi:hypothetical protein